MAPWRGENGVSSAAWHQRRGGENNQQWRRKRRRGENISGKSNIMAIGRRKWYIVSKIMAWRKYGSLAASWQ
jgi:hypothetical protein